MTARFARAEGFAILAGLATACLMLVAHRYAVFAVPAAAVLAAAAFAGSVLALVMVVWIVRQDMAEFTIPDGPLIVLALVGAAARLGDTGVNVVNDGLLIVLDAVLCGGALFLLREGYFRHRGYDGLGFGDVKLAAAGGILLGTTGFAWALLIASVTGLLFALSSRLMAPHRIIDRLAFGAFLAPVFWCVWMTGPWR